MRTLPSVAPRSTTTAASPKSGRTGRSLRPSPWPRMWRRTRLELRPVAWSESEGSSGSDGSGQDITPEHGALKMSDCTNCG